MSRSRDRCPICGAAGRPLLVDEPGPVGFSLDAQCVECGWWFTSTASREALAQLDRELGGEQ